MVNPVSCPAYSKPMSPRNFHVSCLRFIVARTGYQTLHPSFQYKRDTKRRKHVQSKEKRGDYFEKQSLDAHRRPDTGQYLHVMEVSSNESAQGDCGKYVSDLSHP